jgi:hypothetical protein
MVLDREKHPYAVASEVSVPFVEVDADRVAAERRCDR